MDDRERILERTRDLARDLHEALGDALAMVAAYGSVVRGDFAPERSDVNLLVCLERDEPTTLAALGARLQPARLTLRCAPFVVTREELQRGADVFPIKFLELRRSYQVLAGADLLAELRIDPHDLRHACEQELRNATLKVRRSLLLDAPNANALGATLRRFVPQVLGVLRVLMERLEKPPCATLEQLVTRAAVRFDFAPADLQAPLALRGRQVVTWPEVRTATERLLAVSSRLARAVDTLQL